MNVSILGILVLGFLAAPARPQDAPDPPAASLGSADTGDAEAILQDTEAGRVLGVIPDNKIVPSKKSATEEPLTPRAKFALASKDTIDPFTFVLAGFYAGIAQWQNDYPTWKQGGAGYGRRFGAAYADQAVGNYLTEAIMPVMLHEDPRYFRKGTGGKWSRQESVQLFGNCRQRRGGGNFEFVLPRLRAYHRRDGRKVRYPDRQRQRVQRPTGVLAGYEADDDEAQSLQSDQTRGSVISLSA